MNELELPEFDGWHSGRIQLKHNWLEHLTFKLGERKLNKLPEELLEWIKKYPRFLNWLESIDEGLDPASVLDLPLFKDWPEAFRERWKTELRRRFREENGLSRIFPEVQDILEPVDRLVRTILAQTTPTLQPTEHEDLVESLETVRQKLHRIPGMISWPAQAGSSSHADLPTILMIDDQLGRDLLIPQEIQANCNAARIAVARAREYRRAFCQHYLLVDDEIQGDRPVEPRKFLARVRFCAAQQFDASIGSAGGFANTISSISAQLRPDGRFRDGTLAALVIVDAQFNCGPLNEEDGLANQDAAFGINEIVPWLQRYAPGVPLLVMTNTSQDEIIQESGRRRVAYLHKTDADPSDLLYQMSKGGRISPALLRAALWMDPHIVAEDPATLDAYMTAYRAARDPAEPTVLILGESGSGKERLADYIHTISSRKDYHLVVTNCSNLVKDDVAQSTLFGFYANAFSGAGDKDMPGLFHKANNGTLFLDEVGELPESVQAMLLRTLSDPSARQLREIEPMGNPDSDKEAPSNNNNKRTTEKRTQKNAARKEELLTKVNVRIICATDQGVAGFRTAFLRRVAAIRIVLRPLRERPADILPLSRHLLDNRLNAPGASLDRAAEKYLMLQSYPGNVGDLENLLRNALVGKGRRNILTKADLQRAYLNLYPAESTASELAGAAALIIGSSATASGFEGLPPTALKAAHEALQGNGTQILAVLAEWAAFKTDDICELVGYLTGRSTSTEMAFDFLRQLLQLDSHVLRKLEQSKSTGRVAKLSELIRQMAPTISPERQK